MGIALNCITARFLIAIVIQQVAGLRLLQQFAEPVNLEVGLVESWLAAPNSLLDHCVPYLLFLRARLTGPLWFV